MLDANIMYNIRGFTDHPLIMASLWCAVCLHTWHFHSYTVSTGFQTCILNHVNVFVAVVMEMEEMETMMSEIGDMVKDNRKTKSNEERDDGKHIICFNSKINSVVFKVQVHC